MSRASSTEWTVRGDQVLWVLYWTMALLVSLILVAAIAIPAKTPLWYDWISTLPTLMALGLVLALGRLVQKKKRQWEDGRTVDTIRGDKVRSRPEARIANWLHARGYDYQYEPELCGYRPDFFIPKYNVIIEYWSNLDPGYAETRAKKVAAYQQAGFGVVSSEGWEGIESELERKLYRFDKTVYSRAQPRAEASPSGHDSEP